MKELREAIRSYSTEICLLTGATLVSVGAGMGYLPAGVITAGVLILAGGVLSCIGGTP